MSNIMRAAVVMLIILTLGVGFRLTLAQEDPFQEAKAKQLLKSRFITKTHAHKKLPPQKPLAIDIQKPDLRIERALAQNANLQFHKVELGKVVAELKRQYQIQIMLDKSALEEFDLGPDTVVNFTIKDVSLRSALRLLLRELELTFIVRDEVLLITTNEADHDPKIVVYDVADLVTYRDEKNQIWTDYDPLISILINTIDPDSWQELGGEGAIAGHDIGKAHVIVIKNTEKVHETVAKVLDAIRIVAAHSTDDDLPRRARPKEVPLKPMAGSKDKGAAKPVGGFF